MLVGLRLALPTRLRDAVHSCVRYSHHITSELWAQELTKAGEAPANVDAALIWLRYCQRFDLDDDTVRVSAC